MTFSKLVSAATTLAFAVALVAPGVVQAQIVPPGNSAIDQYRETLPAPRGGKGTDAEPNRSPAKVLGQKNVERLEQYGADGEAVAELAAQSAPNRSGSSGGKNEGSTGSSSPIAEVAGQATGAEASGGVSWLLPLVIALAAIGGIIFAVARRRREAT